MKTSLLIETVILLLGVTASLAADETAPQAGSYDPANHEYGVPANTTIVFHVTDDLSGVDTSTLRLMVVDNGREGAGGSPVVEFHPVTARIISGSLEMDGTDPNDIICTFIPDEDLPMSIITCILFAGLADQVGNVTAENIMWSFFIEGANDNCLPQISNLDPAPDTTGVMPRATIRFVVTDNCSGIDLDTIQFNLYGNRPALSSTPSGVHPSQSVLLSGSLYIDKSDPQYVQCEFTPEFPMPEGTITGVIPAGLSDVAGNTIQIDTVWSFEVSDLPDPDGFFPTAMTSWGLIKAGFSPSCN